MFAPGINRYDIRVTPIQAIVYGGLVVGTLDLLDAFIFFGLRGATPIRILQSIASGLLGRDAFKGGMAVGALGAFLHYFIAFAIVIVYFLAARWLPDLVARPFLYGPLYGVAAYLVMNLVVVPLSRASPAPRIWPVVLNGVLIHIVGVGLPAALFARAASAA